MSSLADPAPASSAIPTISRASWHEMLFRERQLPARFPMLGLSVGAFVLLSMSLWPGLVEDLLLVDHGVAFSVATASVAVILFDIRRSTIARRGRLLLCASIIAAVTYGSIKAHCMQRVGVLIWQEELAMAASDAFGTSSLKAMRVGPWRFIDVRRGQDSIFFVTHSSGPPGLACDYGIAFIRNLNALAPNDPFEKVHHLSGDWYSVRVTGQM